MANQQTLSFVACPNHETNVGFGKLYFISQERLKCLLCGKEFTREEIQKEVEKDFSYKLQDLQKWYQQNMAMLYEEKQEYIDILKHRQT